MKNMVAINISSSLYYTVLLAGRHAQITKTKTKIILQQLIFIKNSMTLVVAFFLKVVMQTEHIKYAKHLGLGIYALAVRQAN